MQMWSKSKMRLTALVSGAVLGFTMCSIAGHLIPEKLENFTRFHMFISPETLYYPTVRSVFNTALSLVNHDRPVVIVGGSSVLFGAGQPEGKTIADFLRSDIGGDYTVLNLAMPGGDVAGMALFIAEALQATGYNVFYMADVFAQGLTPIGGNSVYDYIYWQYRSEAFGQKWGARDKYANNLSLTDVAIGQRLNSVFRFDNLWTQLGYQVVFTVYSPLVPRLARKNFWLPRRNLRDPAYEEPKGNFYAHTDESAVKKAMLDIASSKTGGEHWAMAQTTWLATIPDSLRDRTLLILCKKDPRATKLISKEAQTTLDALYNETERRYSAVGLHATQPCKEFGPDDYSDYTHLSVEGARKMAAELSISVRQLSGKQP